ncbi:hypothetical protein LTR53_002361 [Teratosphaeriaceae sp. CCFEE 6253]|nr:hypothetical protein LTR53_002361 [Teratosphaeriaceae sp. CCFEE 6253]
MACDADLESLASAPPTYSEFPDPPPPAYFADRRSAHPFYDASWLAQADGRNPGAGARVVLTTTSTSAARTETSRWGHATLLVILTIVVAATIGGALADARGRRVTGVWA